MRREKHEFLAAIAAAALTMPALALAQDAGGYFGLSTGASKAKQRCDDTSDLPAGATLASCDRRAKGWKLVAGHRSNRGRGFEGSVIHCGKRSRALSSGA